MGHLRIHAFSNSSYYKCLKSLAPSSGEKMHYYCVTFTTTTTTTTTFKLIDRDARGEKYGVYAHYCACGVWRINVFNLEK